MINDTVVEVIDIKSLRRRRVSTVDGTNESDAKYAEQTRDPSGTSTATVAVIELVVLDTVTLNISDATDNSVNSMCNMFNIVGNRGVSTSLHGLSYMIADGLTVDGVHGELVQFAHRNAEVRLPQRPTIQLVS
mmetsp:Transcript_25929/g.38399  ORF Transcript_25929/g.38399 Transcript_25929/m.38399 type:complete len:133 (+) Transcript_25929:39-437(+)